MNPRRRGGRGPGRRRLAAAAIASLVLVLPDPVRADASSAETSSVAASAEGSVVPGTDFSALAGADDGWESKNQRRSWWNAYAKRWDAVLPVGSGSDLWIATGVAGTNARFVAEVDASSAVRPDVYWDGGGRTLYVLRSGTTSRLNVYAYDPAADAYRPVLIGVAVPGINARGAVLHRSPNGYLWASVIIGGGLWVNRSADGGGSWGSAVHLSSATKSGQTGIQSATAGGQTSVVVVAAEDGGNNAGSGYRAFSIDQNAAGWGSAGNWTNESGRLPPFEGTEHADDEMSVTGDLAGNVYAVTETEEGPGSGSRGDPHLILFKRTPAGSWSKTVIERFGGIEDIRKRPTVAVDESNGDLYVFSTAQSRAENSYVRAPLSNLGLLSGAGLVRAFAAPGIQFRNNFVPASVLCAESGLLALIDNLTDQTIWRSTVALDTAPCAIPGVGGAASSGAGVVGAGGGMVSPAAGRAATATSLRFRRTVKRLRALGSLTPPHPGARMKVTLRVRRPDGTKARFVRKPMITDAGRYAASFKRPRRGRCTLIAMFAGDADHDRSLRRRSFACGRRAPRR